MPSDLSVPQASDPSFVQATSRFWEQKGSGGQKQVGEVGTPPQRAVSLH